MRAQVRPPSPSLPLTLSPYGPGATPLLFYPPKQLDSISMTVHEVVGRVELAGRQILMLEEDRDRLKAVIAARKFLPLTLPRKTFPLSLSLPAQTQQRTRFSTKRSCVPCAT